MEPPLAELRVVQVAGHFLQRRIVTRLDPGLLDGAPSGHVTVPLHVEDRLRLDPQHALGVEPVVGEPLGGVLGVRLRLLQGDVVVR